MDDLSRRLTALDRVNVGGLLGDTVNHLREQHEWGRDTEAEKELRRWEELLHMDTARASTLVIRLAQRAPYRTAAQEFARVVGRLRPALGHLAEAVREGSVQRILRWSWSGRAYGYAIKTFVEGQARSAEADSAAAEVEPAGVHAVAPYPVLRQIQTHLERWLDACPAGSRYARFRLHTVKRMRAVRSVSSEYDKRRDVQRTQRDELFAEAERRLGLDPALELVTGIFYSEEQARLLESALVAASRRDVETACRVRSESVSAELAEMTGASQAGPPLLQGLAEILSSRSRSSGDA